MRGGATGARRWRRRHARGRRRTCDPVTDGLRSSPHRKYHGPAETERLGAGAHEEEFAELQRRFDASSSAKKLSETSPRC